LQWRWLNEPLALKMIKQKLDAVQAQMWAKLEEIRASHLHKVSIGSNTEQIVREFLRAYLPLSNRIGHGEIIDLTQNSSKQTDVVILNEYHPYFNDLSQPSLFFIEGVACAGEVKTQLTTEHLASSLVAADAFKHLSPKIPTGTTIQGNLEDVHRFFNKRPYFLFAFESSLTLETIAANVRSYYAGKQGGYTSQIDAIFVLDRGVLLNLGSGQGNLVMLNAQGTRMNGFTPISRESNPNILFNFLGWMNFVMFPIHLPSSPFLPYFIDELPSPKNG
jgi:hypothetical protein